MSRTRPEASGRQHLCRWLSQILDIPLISALSVGGRGEHGCLVCVDSHHYHLSSDLPGIVIQSSFQLKGLPVKVLFSCWATLYVWAELTWLDCAVPSILHKPSWTAVDCQDSLHCASVRIFTFMYFSSCKNMFCKVCLCLLALPPIFLCQWLLCLLLCCQRLLWGHLLLDGLKFALIKFNSFSSNSFLQRPLWSTTSSPCATNTLVGKGTSWLRSGERT